MSKSAIPADPKHKNRLAAGGLNSPWNGWVINKSMGIPTSFNG
jgi:hypothetical protein